MTASSNFNCLKPAYFIEVLPDGRWSFNVDSSMLSCFSRCPKLFYYQYMQMQRRKGMAMALSIGSWWSRTMEHFYMNMASRQKAGAGYVTRQEMMDFAAEAWTICQNCKHQHPGGIETCEQSICNCKENRNMNKLETYQKKRFEEFGKQYGAISMASEYYDKIGGLDNSNLKIVAAEAGFGLRGEMCLYEDGELLINYIGKPDLVVFDTGSKVLSPMDHKAPVRYRSDMTKKYKPHGQMTGYVWAIGQLAKSLGYDTNVDRCTINICGQLTPSQPREKGKAPLPRFMRVYPTFSPSEIADWKRGVIRKVKDLRRCIIEDEWEMRDNSCHHYGGCDFRVVDAVAPENRLTVLKADYTTVEPWIPYAVGDEEDGD
jgi:PD-(D/E)XK nuclease superfamily